MKIQNCVRHEFTEIRVFRTALPFELLMFIMNNIQKHAVKKGDVRRLFYLKYGLLLDRIQINSAFSYLLLKGYISVRNWNQFNETDEQKICKTYGLVCCFHQNFKIAHRNIKWIENSLKKGMMKEKSLTNCLSFTYLK